MKAKQQKIKIVYEEIEVIEYVADEPQFDDLRVKPRFIKRIKIND